MELNLDKCPECGYVNRNHPDVCPSCGCDLIQHRLKVIEEQDRIATEERNSNNYLNAINKFTEGGFSDALVLFLALGKFKDAEDYAEKCKQELYNIAIKDFEDNSLLKLLHQQKNNEYSTCKHIVKKFCAVGEKEFLRIRKGFAKIKNFRDANECVDDCNIAISFLKEYAIEKKEEDLKRKKEIEEQEKKLKAQKDAEAKKRREEKEAEEERKRQQKEEQERQRREAARREAERAAKKKKMIFACVALAVVVAIVIAIIVGVASSNKKKEEAARQEELNYGCSHISLEIKSKTNGEQSYNYYATNFRIVVKNECQVEITYLVCDLKVSAADNGTELWKGDVRLTGDIPAGGNATWDVDLKTTGNQIWSYPLEGLTIQCKFVSAQFDDYTSKDYSDTYKTVHSGNSNYKNNLYQQAKNYYNQGKYQEAYDIFVSLGSYSDCETWADKCNEKIAEQSRLESLNTWKQYLSYVGSDIPIPSTIEYWGTPNTSTTWYEGSNRNGVSCGGYIYDTANGLNFVSDFKSELIAAGYTEVTGGSSYNDMDYYYKKGNIVVGFNDPIANYYDYYVYMVAFKVS